MAVKPKITTDFYTPPKAIPSPSATINNMGKGPRILLEVQIFIAMYHPPKELAGISYQSLPYKEFNSACSCCMMQQPKYEIPTSVHAHIYHPRK